MKPEGACETLLELTFPQSLVAGAQGEQLLIRVRPQAPCGGTTGIQTAPAQHRGETRVRPQAPEQPDQIPPDGHRDAGEHRHVEHGPRYRRALPRGSVIEELVEQDDGGGDDDKGSEPDQHKRAEPPDRPGTRRGKPLPGHALLIDLERRCSQFLHVPDITAANSGWIESTVQHVSRRVRHLPGHARRTAAGGSRVRLSRRHAEATC